MVEKMGIYSLSLTDESHKPRKCTLLLTLFCRSNSETHECCLHKVMTISLLLFLFPSLSTWEIQTKCLRRKDIYTAAAAHRGRGLTSLTRSCANRYHRNVHVNETYYEKQRMREGKALLSCRDDFAYDLVFSDHAGRREITGHERGLGLNSKRERRNRVSLRSSWFCSE